MDQPRLFIAGAGGFGREVCCWLHDLPEADRPGRFCGFLDDDAGALAAFTFPPGVVGALSEPPVQPGDHVLLALGTPALRERFGRLLETRGATLATLVHPSATVARDSVLEPGAILCPRVIVSCNVRVRRGVALNLATTVGHDARIGAWSMISAQCDITGHVALGEGVFMGSGARIIPGVRVGAGARIGAGSVALADVPPGSSCFGVPARAI